MIGLLVALALGYFDKWRWLGRDVIFRHPEGCDMAKAWVARRLDKRLQDLRGAPEADYSAARQQ